MSPSGLSAACVLHPAQLGDLGTPGVPASTPGHRSALKGPSSLPGLPGSQWVPGLGSEPGENSRTCITCVYLGTENTLSKKSRLRRGKCEPLPGALGLWFLRVTCRGPERTASSPTGLPAQTWGAGTQGNCIIPDPRVCVWVGVGVGVSVCVCLW